jgi:hypothetical protein
MHLHKSAHFHSHRSRPPVHWRSRLLVASIISILMAVYVWGIFWFGRELADDVRAEAREVAPGAIVYDRER